MWRASRDAVSVLVGGNAGEVALHRARHSVRRPRRRWAPASCCWSTCSPTCSRRWPSPSPPRRAAARDGRRTPGRSPGTRWRRCCCAGPQRGFTDAVRRLVLVRGAATTVGATGAWATGRLTGPAAAPSTMGLAALIGTQLGQTAWAGRRSPLVLATAAGSLAVLFAVVQTPGVSRFFGCRRWTRCPGWSCWAGPWPGPRARSWCRGGWRKCRKATSAGRRRTAFRRRRSPR